MPDHLDAIRLAQQVGEALGRSCARGTARLAADLDAIDARLPLSPYHGKRHRRYLTFRRLTLLVGLEAARTRLRPRPQ